MALTQMPKVGDKVRYLKDDCGFLTKGKIYEVVSVDAGKELFEFYDDEGDLIDDHLDDWELISEGADNMTALYRAEQRQARKGERIVIVEPCAHDSEDYERGDIFRVEKVDSAGVVTTTGNIVYHEEYEVLPAAMPASDYGLTLDEIFAQAAEIEGAHGSPTPGKRDTAPDSSHKNVISAKGASDDSDYFIAQQDEALTADELWAKIAERQAPDKPAQIRMACDELRDLLIRKNHDYGDSFAKQYEKYGLMSALIRMDDKMRRLETLVDGQQAQVAESIEDTLADLAGYALLALVEARASR